MSLSLYLYISFIITILYLIYSLVSDGGIISLEILIQDLSESTIIGGAWIISIPILVVTNIVLLILYAIGDDE